MRIQFKILTFLSLTFTFLAFIWEKPQLEQVPKTSLLWKIEGNGLKHASYLFGTMHLIQKDYFYFPSSLEKIIKKSDVVLSEIALDKMGDQVETMKYLYLKEGQLMDFFSLQQQDSLFQWSKLKLHLEKDAFTASFGKMKPFVVVQTAVQITFFGKTESYEMKIKEIADKSKISFDGFETVGEQISFFDNLSKEKQAAMVMESIRDEAKSNESAIKMQAMYKRQQLDSLYLMLKSEGGAISNEEEVFLTNRNAKWIPKIKETIATKKTFIAVGAAHLAGEKGVIELLRKEGYTLTQIQF